MDKWERPWGWYINVKEEKNVLKLNTYVFILLRINFFKVIIKEYEHWVIVKGTAKVTVMEDELILHKNQNVFIPKETLHRMENIGEDNVEFVETQIGDYLEEDDIVRYEDDFGRVK